MALTFPRDTFFEMFLNGTWHDVMTTVRQTTPIKIIRGRGGEQGEVSPGTLTCKLENDTGDYTPSDPTGQWFGSIKKGTPVRFGLPVAEDTFTGRTVASGWGTATSGEVWAGVLGEGGSLSATDASVGSGVGNHSVPAADAYRFTTLPVSYRNIEVVCTTTVAITNITGGAIEPCNIMVRATSAVNYYFTRISISATEVLTISIHDKATGQLVTPVTVTGLVDASTSKVIRVKMQVEGNTIRAKVYTPGAEPLGWHVWANNLLINVPGEIGIRSGVAAGNTNTKPIVFANDDIEVRQLRFSGEIAELKPRWSIDHKDRWAELTASTVLRRIRQGKNPVKSSMRRGYLADAIDAPVQYWPCEEGKDAKQFSSAIDSQPLRIVSGDPRLAQFGDFLSSAPIPVINGSTWSGSASPPFIPTTAGQVRFFLAVPAGGHGGGTAALMDVYLGSPAGLKFRLNYLSGGDFQVVAYSIASGAALYTSGTLSFGVNGKLYRMGLGLTANGANIDYEVVRLDYATGFNGAVGPTTSTAGVFTWIERVVIAPDANVTDIALGQVVVQSNLTLISELSSEFRAWTGETPINRAARLSRDNGLDPLGIGIYGSSSAHKMGPQTPSLLTNLLKECQDTIQGTLYDSRFTGNSLVLRTINGTYTQDSRLSLNYANQEIAEPFQPSDDDKPVRNDITVRRSQGGEFRVSQETGPLNAQEPGTDDDAVGRYDQQVGVNTQYETQLPNVGGWELHLGTTEVERWPKLNLKLRAASLASKQGAILDLDLDDRITVTGMSTVGYYDDLNLIVRGYTETYNTAYDHSIEFNCAPYDPYTVAVFNQAASRWDTAGTTLGTGIDDNDTAISLVVNKGQLWTTTASNFPMDIMLGGERITLSGVTGATSPQAGTASARSVNGVVKPHSAGAKISVAGPVYFGR